MPTTKMAHIEWVNSVKRGMMKHYRRSLFFDKLRKVPDWPGCWTWSGRLNNGRPEMTIANGGKVDASFFSAQYHGMEGKMFEPTCGNKRCVRPDHLVAVRARSTAYNRNEAVRRFYTENADIAGDLSLKTGYILGRLGGTRMLLVRWRKANPELLHYGDRNGKH